MPSSRPPLLSRLIVDAADRDADAPALIGGDALDRSELARRVAALGTALRDQGVAPGDRVVVCATKSVDSFVAMHAALYAGAIAAPVDPLAPAARLADVAREVAPRAVVLDERTAARWPSPDDVITVGAAADGRPTIDRDDVDAIDPRGPADRSPADLAYLITTSGSTGRPKCIAHTHASGMRYAELAADCYALRRDDRMANVAPFHFDQSTFELYAGPLAGATTVLVPDAVLRFPASVSELLERERVTTWYSVPTILRQLLERGALDRRDLSALRWVLFGGEVFPPQQLRRLMAALPGARFSNVYGPAEVNQCAFHHLDRPPVGDDPVPIGRAWPDTELRLVDEAGTTLTGAARGRLLVRTATAMAGYWRRPDLDEQAFEIGDGSGRWYRTGDVVDRDVDGVMTFVGRVDRQVKVRGVRIELEAVESALGAVEGVTGAAAVVDRDGSLVGVVESSAGVEGAPVLRALRASLPPGSLPDRVVVVPALARSTSGKVDVVRAVELLDQGAPA